MNSFFSPQPLPKELKSLVTAIKTIGPFHSELSACVQITATLIEEKVKSTECKFGYSHRAQEKLGERHLYQSYIPYTDRLNDHSAVSNNVGYVLAIEKLLNLRITDRCTWIRMICCELARIVDHFLCLKKNATSLKMTAVLPLLTKVQVDAYRLIEILTGARITTSYVRIGGLRNDFPEGFSQELRQWIKNTKKNLKRIQLFLISHPFWKLRTCGIGVFTLNQCLQYSFSGPNARASGLEMDLRKNQPYLYYSKIDFNMCVLQDGDTYSRQKVRLMEVEESLKILEQCLDQLKPGPIWTKDFDLLSLRENLSVPRGEVYHCTESPNGELGFYVVSQGGSKADRMRIRSPSVWHFQGFEAMSQNAYWIDLYSILASLNIISGELDR